MTPLMGVALKQFAKSNVAVCDSYMFFLLFEFLVVMMPLMAVVMKQFATFDVATYRQFLLPGNEAASTLPASTLPAVVAVKAVADEAMVDEVAVVYLLPWPKISIFFN